ncbi:asparagine synthase-related protein, partial [Streptomyces sp. NPDC051907]|uniref:asparagine synthase-related protein n=1 Tax=Streptomyces sp. NPDC051907 TaxID=3155284 RepID=UPI00342E94C8
AQPVQAALPVTALLARGTALTGLARDILSPARLKGLGMFDPAAVDRLLTAQLARPADRLATAVWSLLMFELWREEYGVARLASRLPRRAAAPADLPVLSRRLVAY